MRVGSLVKIFGSPWLGMGIVVDYSQNSATVFFPNASGEHYPYDKTAEVWRERLEVLCE